MHLNSEDLSRIELELKRTKKPITITIEIGTLETMLRELKGEPHRDFCFREILPKEKQDLFRRYALADLEKALNAAFPEKEQENSTAETAMVDLSD